jgi:hypothetical protein
MISHHPARAKYKMVDNEFASRDRVQALVKQWLGWPALRRSYGLNSFRFFSSSAAARAFTVSL